MRLVGIAMLLAASFCLAQDSGDFKPATSNVLDAQYPRVDSNSRVQIRFKAPDATKVRVNFWSGPKAEMEKQPDGFWTFLTPPLAPGLHYYTLIVDGAEVSDPGSTAYFGGSKWASAVEVPEAGADYYLPQEVPHGQVREVWYHSSVTSTWRHALVYLPPDYDTQTKSAISGALSAAWRRGRRDRMDQAGPCELHPRQSDCERKLEADDHRDGEWLRQPRRLSGSRPDRKAVRFARDDEGDAGDGAAHLKTT